MTLLEDIQEHFNTNCLYEVLGTTKDATEKEITKAYRKTSLKIHPDRVDDARKGDATIKFQILAQVHYILRDEEKRKLYDDHGIVANEDTLDGEADWSEYWRILFPKISESDIQNYLDKYTGSKEEEEDLILIYNKFQGDIDKISATHISWDDERSVQQLQALIDEGKIENFDKFSCESDAKKQKRKRRAEREAKEAKKAKKEMESKGSNLDDLTALIQRRSQKNFDSMIASLEDKYAKKASKGIKRKRGRGE